MQFILHPYPRFFEAFDCLPLLFDEVEKFLDARAPRIGVQPQESYSRLLQRQKPAFVEIVLQQYKSLFQSSYPVIFRFL